MSLSEIENKVDVFLFLQVVPLTEEVILLSHKDAGHYDAYTGTLSKAQMHQYTSAGGNYNSHHLHHLHHHHGNTLVGAMLDTSDASDVNSVSGGGQASIGQLHLTTVAGAPDDLDMYTHSVLSSANPHASNSVGNNTSSSNASSHAHVHFLNQSSASLESPIESKGHLEASSGLNSTSGGSTLMSMGAPNSSTVAVSSSTGTLRNSSGYIRSQ